jgi:TolB-like protein/Tfp pilus assembly protein PilF
MSFIDELKRRNVFRVGIAYAVSAWVLLQIVDLVLENISAPDWVMQVFMLAVGIGFPFALIIAWAFEMTTEGVKLEKNVDRSQSITQVTGQKMNRGISIALAIAVVLLLVDRFRPEPNTEPQPEATATVQSAGAVPALDLAIEKSIAVLPFVNMSSDPEQDYFADGISEEILNALAKVDELKVAGRTSSFAFKGKNEDLLAIGKVLRVNHILEGSVRKSGTRIRITAQLIKVDDGFHMWSETYDRELNDIFVIQDEISAAILVQLKTQLLGKPLPTVKTDTRAYELYLLAKQRIYERNQASLEMAVTLLDEAIGIDAAYAPAFAQLGIANQLLSDQNYGSLPQKEAGEIAKGYLDTALKLDPQNAEALAGLGLYHRNYSLDHEKALEVLRQAVAINPSLVNANTWLSNELGSAGEIRASLQLLEETFKRDPLHPPTFSNLQQAYVIVGRNDEAQQMLESLRAYLPGDGILYSDLGQVALMSGRLAEAEEQFEKAYETEPLNTVNRVWFGFTLWNTRQYERMVEIAPEALAVLALSRLGRSEEALIQGAKAIGKGINPAFYFQILVENERFAELIQTLESRWADLDDFADDWGGGNGYGFDTMGHIALSYRQLGNHEKFTDAMQRFRTALDMQLKEGANNWVLNWSQAHYAVLASDYESAIGFVEKSFEQGAYLDTENKTAWPVFKALNGNPRYEAAKATMNARLEEELALMKFEQTATGD